jgi:hypothetical protein
MNDRWTHRLSEYIDGDLGDRDRRALETHLAACATCRDEIEALRAVKERAHGLEPVPPATDLWPAIAARIEAQSRPAPARRPGWASWRLTLSLPQASVAALALVVISAGAMWWTVGRAPRLVTRGPSVSGSRSFATGPGPAAPSPKPSPGTARSAGSDEVLTAAFTDPRYDATIAELQSVLDNERARLDPRTIEVVEKNLRIIDRAVAEARRAVAADPSSLYLREHLAHVMMQKVTLLRQATQIASAQG